MNHFPNKIHFIGIGGVGMSGLAFIMSAHGYIVSGSDMADSETIAMLRTAGITITLGHDPENIPQGNDILIVRTSAISEDNIEYLAAFHRGLRIILRGRMLAELATMYKCVIAVSGTHGKTSVTALLVHILKAAGLEPGYMIGGKVQSWTRNASQGDLGIFVTESDESDGTQVYLKPNILLVTNIEDDHSWTLGGEEVLYENFKRIATASEYLIYGNNEIAKELFSFHPKQEMINYSDETLIAKIRPRWGEFQISNAQIAYQAARHIGISSDIIMNALKDFTGVERRMSIRYESNNVVLIEDYAHHPTEIKAAICAIKKNYSNYKLKIIFQPHRYARLEKYFEKFANELACADEIFITPVFAAWSETGKLNSSDLANAIGEKASCLTGTFEDSAKIALKKVEKKEVIAIFGAGDIQEIVPFCISILKDKN